jgi:PAS domain S-box-containing protein
VLSISGRYQRIGAILIAAALAGGLIFLYLVNRLPPLPQRVLRIGFEQNPPLQLHTPDGLAGLAVEAANEAAKRAGLRIQWVEPGVSSEEAFRKHLVDLWPVMADRPERRSLVHFTRPWLHSGHALVVRSGSPIPGPAFAGRIALFRLPLHARMARHQFPSAQLVQLPEASAVLKEVCTGAADAGFLEFRTALAVQQPKPAECASVAISTRILPNLTNQLAIASTREAARAAEALRQELGNMFRDGAMALIMAKYSYYGLGDTWAAYDSMEAAQSARWLAGGVSGLTILFAVLVWRAVSARQRKRTEAALRGSEQRFRRVFEEGPLGLALVGRDYRFLNANTALCRMVGYDETELVCMSFVDITHPDDVRSDVELAEQLFKRQIPFYRIQKRYVRKTGEIIWINLTASILLGADGEPVHGMAMVEDITDAKRTQEEALFRQKLESVGTLAGGIAHDFNNLLGAVQAQAELALDELDAGSPCNEELKAIRDVAIRGSDIVRQLMIYAGKESAVVELVDLSKTVEDMLLLLKVSVTKRAIIEADLDRGLPAIRASAAQIRQIVMNLITNASDAIEGRDGVIRVSTRRVTRKDEPAAIPAASLPGGDYVELRVSDTGRGMSPRTQAKVFDPFFTTKSAGRGLGLAVVQGIVRSLSGAIHLASEPGKGATFQVWLPASEIAASEDGVPVSGIAQPSPRPCHETVLVVEDEGHLRQPIVKMLRKTGFEVFEAADGTSAIDLLRANGRRIDVILLDMTIPGASSHEVVAEAANVRPDIGVILTSAYSQEMIEGSMNAPQIRAFIRKPFQLEDLLKTFRHSLSQASSEIGNTPAQ